MARFFSFLFPKSPELTITEGEKSLLKVTRAKGINTPDDLWSYLMPDYENTSNSIAVTKETALTLSAVYNALNILSDSLNVPISVKKKIEGGSAIVTESDRYEYAVHVLLHTSPNLMNTPTEFIQLLEWSRQIYGNGYAEIIRDGSTKPIALRWLHPDKVKPEKGAVSLFYTVAKDNTTTYNVRSLDMIHVKTASFNGITGISPINLAAQSLGFSLALQKTGNQYYQDGMTNKVVLSHPGVLGTAGQDNLKKSFDKKMKDGSTMVLEEGLKPYLLSITPEQSQFLQSRQFSVTEVARWFNLPEFMLANSDPTYSNVGSFSLHFVTHNVRPRVRMYEQEFNWKLLTNYKDFYTEFNLNALLRSDIKARFDSYAIGIQNRILSPNEVRQIEGWNSYEGGDKYENPNVLTDQNNVDDKDNDNE